MNMNRLRMVPGLLLLSFAAAACDTGLLDVEPQDEISESQAIIDLETANAALAGAYSALQFDGMYGEEALTWLDVLTDDVEHTGTFGSYGSADLLNVTADNFSIENMWNDIYNGINRVNVLIEKVAALDNVSQVNKDRITGEALGIRALEYFQLVRLYGGVPLVLEPFESLDEASQVSRASASDVYAAIESDLSTARSLLSSGGVDNSGDRTRMTPGFTYALEAQVHLQQGEWAAAETAAMEVVNSGGAYTLVSDYASLFEPTGAPTSEDIFRVAFNAVDANFHGYYYQFEGRFETGATEAIYNLYDQELDQRFAASFDEVRPDGIEVVKFPTTVGTENIHVIRYSELLLILAEALAQQGELEDAVMYLEMVRDRAGLIAYPDAAVDTQAEVLDAIYLERRLELAFEGERWFDLARWDIVDTAVGRTLPNPDNLLPLPVSELDVAPNLEQNEGYEE
jgi:hypothetical protein